MNQARAFHSRIDRDRWRTPLRLWQRLNREFDFGLDAAADTASALCERWIDPAEDALIVEWGPRALTAAVWINPPYSRRAGGLARWMRRCSHQAQRWGLTVVALVPAAIGSAWWTWTHQAAASIRLLSRRLHHRHPDTGEPIGGSSFGSAVVIFEAGRSGPAVYSLMEV